MVSHRFRSISSVFGGKNSKEIAGDFGVWCPSGMGGVTSVMARQTPRISGRTSGLAATRQNMPNDVGQTAHHQWEVAQFLYMVCQACLIPREMARVMDKIGLIWINIPSSTIYSCGFGNGQNIICYMAY